MDITQIVLLRGFFRAAKYMVTAPQSAMSSYYISEAGTITRELMNMHTGFMNPKITRKAWIVIHSLKMRIFKNGLPTMLEPSLLISDRSYVPLDPQKTIKAKDKDKLISLKDIAKLRHAEAKINVSRSLDQQAATTMNIIYGEFALCALFGIIQLIKYWVGSG